MGLLERLGVRGVFRRKKWPRAPAVRMAQYHRVLIDGEELLVRRIIKITDDEVVYEDPHGNIKIYKRKKTGILALAGASSSLSWPASRQPRGIGAGTPREA